jgi:hypothetical protein
MPERLGAQPPRDLARVDELPEKLFAGRVRAIIDWDIEKISGTAESGEPITSSKVDPLVRWGERRGG